MELLRNCSHGSDITVLMASDIIGDKWLLKSSVTPIGITSLRQELAGWGWYCERRNIGEADKFFGVDQSRDNYLRIRLRYINGEKPDYRMGLRGNLFFVEQVISHYCQVWPKDDVTVLHGDLSLDIVIFTEKGVNIIDWEHFSERVAPWGFDAFYFLFESLWFDMRLALSPSEEAVKIIVKNLNALFLFNSSVRQMMRMPLTFVRNFMVNNSALWSMRPEEFAEKFPVVKFSEKQALAIDMSLSKLLI